MKTIKTLILAFFTTLFLNAQAPDFTYVDLNGQSHSLYADYLDQGIPVILLNTAAWAPPNFNLWHTTGYMENFFQNYGIGSTPDVMVLMMEADPSTTDEDLYGTGNNTVGDWVTGTSYPIINVPDNSYIENYELIYFPSMVMICADGTAYTDYSTDPTSPFIGDPLLHYGDLLNNSEALDQRFFDNCGYSFNRSQIIGQTFKDSDADCVYNGAEPVLPNFTAHITGPNTDVFRISNDLGIFRNLVDSGHYEIDVVPSNVLWDMCNPNQSIDVTNNVETFELDFGATSIIDCPYPILDITAPFIVRCFDSYIVVDYCNEGTADATDAYIEVTLDSLFEFNSSMPAPDAQNGDVLTYELGTLGVGECGEIIIDFTTSCDADTAQVHCYSAQFFPDTLCIPTHQPAVGFAIECQENVFSWDPNDKRAFPLGEGATNEIKPNTELKYQIRFQNEGSWQAYNVVIEDLLPEELDIRSLRLGASSHNCVVETEGRMVKFIFEGINLPYSDQDEAGSQGFVNFYINQIPDLPNGKTIENTADIFFDFNEAVVTNTHVYTINDLSSTHDVHTIEFGITPNPAHDVISLNNIEKEVSVLIYTLDGKEVMTTTVSSAQQEIKIQTLSTGMYLLEITDEDGNKGIEKLIISK